MSKLVYPYENALVKHISQCDVHYLYLLVDVEEVHLLEVAIRTLLISLSNIAYEIST